MHEMLMRPVFLGVAAMFLYALQNFIFDKGMSRLSPDINMFLMYVTVLTLTLFANAVKMPYNTLHVCVMALIIVNLIGIAIVAWTVFGSSFSMPDAKELAAIVFSGIVLYFADRLIFVAYHTQEENNLYILTLVGVLFPVFAALIKFVADSFTTGWKAPSPGYIVVFLLAGSAVTLLAWLER